MNILHLTPYYAPAYAFGGVVQAVEGMTWALAQRGHTVTVLTTDALDREARYEGVSDEMRDGVRVVRTENIVYALRGRFNLSTPRRMRRLAEKLLADVAVLHIHEFRTTENLIVTPIAHRMNIPIVLSPHGTLAAHTGRSRLKIVWDKLLSPAVAHRIDHLIGLTQDEADEAAQFWRRFGRRREPLPTSVVPNGINLDDFAKLPDGAAFRARYGLGEGAVCLFMGRLHRRKGVDILIRAFKAADIPHTRLVIVGPDEGMRGEIAPLLDERIVLTGYLTGDDRLAAYAAADMLALPAVGEGLPMVVLEAMGAGLPVIISPECHLPQVSEVGAGLEVEPTVAAMTIALRELLTDADKRASMGRAGQQLVREHFTWGAVAGQLEQIYQTLERQRH